MDLIVYALCKKLIANSISSLGEVFSLKGNLSSVDDLPTGGNSGGDLYLVGPNTDGSYDEYYWTDNGSWELMGSTGSDLSGYINVKTLYAGKNNSGTIENPAEDTILYIVNNENYRKFLAKDNEEEYTPTQNYHPATKLYVDNKINTAFNLEII